MSGGLLDPGLNAVPDTLKPFFFFYQSLCIQFVSF